MYRFTKKGLQCKVLLMLVSGYNVTSLVSNFAGFEAKNVCYIYFQFSQFSFSVVSDSL